MSVEILVDGVDQYPVVHFPTARFLSKVNGVPGEAFIRIRDEDRNKTFTPGMPVILKIDGANVWRGFITAVERPYITSAYNVAQMGDTRFIDLRCVDVNILLSRRIVFQQSDPADVLAPLYPPGTADVTAIADLVADWLDLSGDGIDTSSLVENVGDITVDQAGRAWSGSYEWGQAMASIAMLPAAIYYIDPDLNLVYTDVDTPNAPFAMSDVPSLGVVGYREMEILKDGGGLANDVLAWGIGYGSQTPVFVRDEDATSQAEHGLWQSGTLRYGVYKQATINRIAESIIDGSPQSKRGSKNDKVAVSLSTYTSGFRPAQKIDFTSEVWDFNDVIPIREMEVTFEAPENPKYALTLSHEIDATFGFVDQFMINFGLPTISLNPPRPPGFPFPPDDECECISSITIDDFNRTEAVGWVTTTPDGYGSWDISGTDSDASVSPGAAHLVRATAGGTKVATLSGTFPGGSYPWSDAIFTIYTTFQIDAYGTTDPGDPTEIPYVRWGIGSGSSQVYVYVDHGQSGPKRLGIGRLSGVAPEADVVISSLALNTDYVVEMEYDTSTGLQRARLYLAGSAVPDWQVLRSAVGEPNSLPGAMDITVQRPSSSVATNYTFGPILETTNLCDEIQFDDFDRTLTSQWGETSGQGGAWTTSGSGTFGVNGSAAYATNTSITGWVPGAIWDATAWTMLASYQTTSLASGRSLRFAISDDLSNYAEVFLDFNGGTITVDDNIDSNDDTAAHTFGTDQRWLRWQFDGSVHRAREWSGTDLEPSTWDVETTLPDLGARTYLIMAQTSPGSGLTIYTNSIDFDWPDRPCNQDCTDAGGVVTRIIDDFGRTVGSGWGNASSGGIWTQTTTFGVITDSVDGDYGVSSNPGGSSAAGYETTTVPAWFTDPATTYIEFRVLIQTTIRNQVWAFFDSSFTNGIEFQYSGVSNRLEYGMFYSAAHHFTNSSGTARNTSGIPFWAAIKLEGSEAYFKEWLATDPEPGTWQGPTATSSTLVPSDVSRVRIANGQVGTAGDCETGYISATFVGASCTPVEPVESGLPTDPTGRGCENATRVDGTTYATSVPYMPLSTLVYVDGLLQRRGVDYTEDSPRHLDFTTTISASSTVRVCYYPQEGPP